MALTTLGSGRREDLEIYEAVLRRHMETGEPFLAFVDPQNPNRAFLYRNMSAGKAGAVIAIICGALGALILYGGIRMVRKGRPNRT